MNGTARSLALLGLGALVLSTPVLGCGGGGPRVYPVAGVVRYAGQPLSGGTVMFVPETGRTVGASIASDGSYRIEVIAGKHRVAILPALSSPMPAESSVPPDQQMTPAHQISRTIASPIPEKYTNFETSGLVLEVEPVDGNTLDIDLK